MQLGNHLRATALVSVAVVVAACGGSNAPSLNLAPADQQILRANNGVEPNSFDPTQQTYTYERAVGIQTFDSLFRAKADSSDVEPLGATSYDVSSDGLTYTFHLRTNEKWSDGKPVVASDWVYGWKHFLNPALAAGYVDPFFDLTIKGAGTYGSVDVSSASAIDAYLNGLGLSAPDDKTFVVALDHPAAYFKWVATLWMAVPLRKDIIEQAAGGSFASTDATKAEAWANNASTIIGNGPYKIKEIASKDHVTLVPNPNYWAPAPHPQQIVLYEISDGNTAYSQYQTGALDIIGVPLADPGKAAQLAKMKLITRNSTASKTLNQFLADQWSTNLGVTIQLDVIDSKTVTRNIRKGQFDIYGLDGWISDYPDQQDWFDIFVTGSCHSLNWGCVSDTSYDDLVNKADAESDKTKRAQGYSQAQKKLIDNAVVGFMYQPYEYDLIKPYVQGLTVTTTDDQNLPGDGRYNQAYITQH